MAEPLGKREMIAWTICGVLAVVAALAYTGRKYEPLPERTPAARVDTVHEKVRMFGVISDSPRRVARESLPAPEMSTPLTRREPTAPYDTAWVRIGARQYQTTIQINGEPRGELNVPKFFPAPAGTVRLSLHAPNCMAWDTTIQLTSGARETIGIRNPRC